MILFTCKLLDSYYSLYVITQFTAEFGINSTCNALYSILLRLVLFRKLLVLLIPNTTVNYATYTNYVYHGLTSVEWPQATYEAVSSLAGLIAAV